MKNQMLSKKKPLISIGIPTYNRANGFLKNAIESALSQTYGNIEVIVSDNCSPDNTPEVVKSIKDNRIRYFRQKENIGPNNNFNFCVSQARGEYFLLLQDDDLIDNDFVEICLESVDYSTDIGIIRTGTRIIDGEGKVIKESPNKAEGESLYELILSWFNFKTAFYLCSTLFNTNELKKIGGFQSRYNLFQDVVAEVKLAAVLGFRNVPDIKASFRKHPGEMTFASKVNDWCNDSLYLLDIICGLLPSNQQEIRKKGLRFFAHLNYNRARAVRKQPDKFVAYLNVYKKFDYSLLPPALNSLLKRSMVPRAVRFIKKTVFPN